MTFRESPGASSGGRGLPVGTSAKRLHRAALLRAVTFLGVLGWLCPARYASAGGSPENILLIINPTYRDSMYIGNYYKQKRNIPDQNVLYIDPGATDFAEFASVNLDELFGTLANRHLDDHIDYIVLAPHLGFYIDAPGLVTDGCSPVTRFSLSGIYTMAFIADEVLAGGSSQKTNQYYRNGTSSFAFDSSIAWLGGIPDNSASARRYFIGAMLGYLGTRGNTLAEITAMIDRSVAVDGTRPAGTFYFMNNAGDPARNVRSPQFQAVVNAIIGAHGAAQILDGLLPTGHQDCLGIMTGSATPGIATTDMTILPGAFCDHLTSWAATFDISSQEKLSLWIAKGASGSWGEVEEPCNYTGKFPHARVHLHYFKGLSLGEAAFRSVGFVPFQGLLYGDPMTRPFAYLPVVAVNDAPTDPVSGMITLTPTATTADPTTAIASFDLLVDGVLSGSRTVGQAFSVDTTKLSDGRHDVRVLAYDNSNGRTTGRWLGSLTVNNFGHSTSMGVAPLAGNWSTPFIFNVSAAGGSVVEVRVTHNGKAVAAAPGASAALTIYGGTLGAGLVSVQAEALLADGELVRSPSTQLNIAYSNGTPSGQPPHAFSYTKHVRPDGPFVVELPIAFDNPNSAVNFSIVSSPAKSSVQSGQSGPFHLMRPSANACGVDSFTYKASSPVGDSNTATVTLIYDYNPCDVNCDGSVNQFDINDFVTLLSPNPPAPCRPCAGDSNEDGTVNQFDINTFIDCLSGQ